MKEEEEVQLQDTPNWPGCSTHTQLLLHPSQCPVSEQQSLCLLLYITFIHWLADTTHKFPKCSSIFCLVTGELDKRYTQETMKGSCSTPPAASE